jgi:hypothetical protein
MIFPDRPTGNAWQLIGNSFNQGAGIVDQLGAQQNALQALVERRTQAALEQKRLERKQAADDWELQQKQDDEEKKQKFVENVIKLSSKGVPNPDVTTKIPASTQVGKRDIVSPSSDLMQPSTSIGGMAAPVLGRQQPDYIQPGYTAQVPTVEQTPEQTITTPGGYRDAKEQDYKDLAFQSGIMDIKDYTEPSNYDKAYGTMKGSIDADPTFAKQRAGKETYEEKLALAKAKADMLAGKPLTEYQRAMLSIAMSNKETQQSNKEFDQEQKLQEKFLSQTKDFRDVRDAFGRIQVSYKDPSPAGDLALIFNYMKMLDPGSTVREGEFASAAASGSFGDRLQSAANKIINGERLSADQRKDFLDRSKSLYLQQAQQAKKTKEETEKTAQSYKLNSSRVTTDLNIADETPKPTQKRRVWNPATGRVE